MPVDSPAVITCDRLRWSSDSRDRVTNEGPKVVRGGSWRDRPKFSRSAYRWSYPSYQKVYNVGFRVVIEPAVNRFAEAGGRER
jgi:formylglycine-generating enzyme required for sulfatase activity